MRQRDKEANRGIEKAQTSACVSLDCRIIPSQDGLETRNDRTSSSFSSGKAGTGSHGRGFEEGTSVVDSGDFGTMRAADRIILLDTMLVSAYMQCSPPRHTALVR